MGKNPFYITTTLPYSNAKPHIGFAMEVVRADAIARYKRLLGFDVFFNTGTDEHGMKIYQRAKEEGKEPQEFLDEKVKDFWALREKLNLSYDKFIRTTDKDHVASAQELWKICDKNGYIYKKNYRGFYCVGCEMFVTEKDMVNGECPHHPGEKLVEIEEENYFFKYSAFTKKLLELYEKNPNFVIPDFRLKEIKKFVSAGLEDFSISRVRERMPWGVSVPGDEKHVIYVWFDALANYISTLGWPGAKNFEKYWIHGTPVQYCGKDNLHFQAARWQAMLMAADLPPSSQIIIDGFITSGGQKMSKSIGNVIDPAEVISLYGTDALRYFLLRELSAFEDGDFTMDKFKEAYNANLANGLGNLVSRIMKMAEDHLSEPVNIGEIKLPDEYKKSFEGFDLQRASDFVFRKVNEMDKLIQETEPFKLVKTDKPAAMKIIRDLVEKLGEVVQLLKPLLPGTAELILSAINENKKPAKPIFERK
ncbi:MAG TPA: methionine--tRNA ligase [Candidatus Paceibacterota bacterium]|nr:methionine--tRNA ligase [Candidatus Paceibacterota bacterium]HRZ34174.1 methionine--tRNA ligase [Candidatus Paceibacterota bacterium]